MRIDWQPIIALLIMIVLLIYTMQKAHGEEELYSKIRTIDPQEVNGQYCYVKIIIEEQEDRIIKKEVLECADGRKGIDTPGYWELFAQFYYRDISAPEYCRYYSRPNHVFKSYGKTCLKKNGRWEVR